MPPLSHLEKENDENEGFQKNKTEKNFVGLSKLTVLAVMSQSVGIQRRRTRGPSSFFFLMLA